MIGEGPACVGRVGEGIGVRQRTGLRAGVRMRSGFACRKTNGLMRMWSESIIGCYLVHRARVDPRSKKFLDNRIELRVHRSHVVKLETDRAHLKEKTGLREHARRIWHGTLGRNRWEARDGHSEKLWVRGEE